MLFVINEIFISHLLQFRWLAVFGLIEYATFLSEEDSYRPGPGFLFKLLLLLEDLFQCMYWLEFPNLYNNITDLPAAKLIAEVFDPFPG